MDQFNQTLYDGAVLSALTIAYSFIGDKVLKTSIGDPSKPTLSKFVKLGVAVAAAVATKGELVKRNILPSKI